MAIAIFVFKVASPLNDVQLFIEQLLIPNKSITWALGVIDLHSK